MAGRGSRGQAVFLFTSFLSAFLLFVVQPMLGKAILPWFGGGSEVWSSCLVFFQAALLGGYLYAHVLSFAAPRIAMGVHATGLAAVCWWLPLGMTPPEDALASPGWDALATLGAGVAAPYIVLAATAPLLQRWFAGRFAGEDPYRLYAVSNAGSFLALLSYPVLIEPLLGVAVQFWVWSGGFVVFAAACLAAGWGARTVSPTPEADEATGVPNRWLVWVALPATASALLVATTNQLTQDLAVLPFLWVLPLAVYLLSFVLTFGRASLYRRRWYSTAFAVVAPIGCILTIVGSSAPALLQIAGYCVCLFAATMLCHGELVLNRPPAARLTGFYLAIAAGGAVGGAAVALGAPMVFAGYWEYWIALAATSGVVLLVWQFDQSGEPRVGMPMQLRVGLAGAAALATLSARGGLDAVDAERNFYGVVMTMDVGEGSEQRRELFHGRVRHGMQFLADNQRRWPTTYYGLPSGASLVLRKHPKRTAGEPLRVALVGLGVGTLAAYGERGDEFVFYELNPAVTRIAREQFTFLADAEADIRVIDGDARVNLARAEGRFDAILLDAFSSGAVPAHLLTTEFADVAHRLLAPNGVLAFHVSNPAIALEPVVRGIAEHLGLGAKLVVNPDDGLLGVSASEWVVVGAADSLAAIDGLDAVATDWPANVAPVVWTDDYASLWPLMRF